MPSSQVKKPLEGLEGLFLKGERELYRDREVIYYPGAWGDSIFYIKSGHVKISLLDTTGKRLVLGIRGAGDLVGEGALLGEERRRHFVQALGETLLVRIERDRALSWLKHNPEASLQLLRWIYGQMVELEELLLDVAFRDIKSRLSRRLLQLAKEFGVRTEGGVLIGFRLTHRDLAEMIASARENTTLALNRLEQEGILDKSRYRIVVKNEESLKRKCEVA